MKSQAGECQKSKFAEFGKGVSTALSSRPAVVKVGKEDKAASLDDMPAEMQTKLFDATDAIHDESRTDLADILAKLRLGSEQESALHARIDQMNKRIGDSLDRLLALTTDTTPVAPRAVIDALADGLNAVREADDAFLASLDEGQRQQLRDVHFDMTSQVDPTLLVTRLFALATAFPASSDDDSEPTTTDEPRRGSHRLVDSGARRVDQKAVATTDQ
ncbi:hypothetical protein BH11MYX3_BH11MYX3_29940 [soil metagenome]